MDKLIDFRDKLRNIQQKSLLEYKVLENKYMLPVNIFRITQDYSNNKEHIELKPEYIVESINKFIDDYDYRIMIILNKNDKYMKQDNRSLKFLFEVGLYEFLAPVKCIFDYGLTKIQFDKLLDEIKLNYIHPTESDSANPGARPGSERSARAPIQCNRHTLRGPPDPRSASPTAPHRTAPAPRGRQPPANVGRAVAA
jgi:hypothetical protein